MKKNKQTMSSFSEREPQYITQQKQSSWFCEHRDLQASAMSVDWTSNWVLLAGRYILLLFLIGFLTYLL